MDAEATGTRPKRFMVRNRVFLIADLAEWAAIPVIALALRVGVSAIWPYAAQLVAFTLAAIACKFFALWLAGLYRRVWRYASVDELTLIGLAVLGAGLVTSLTYFLFLQYLPTPGLRLPRSVFIIDTLLTLISVGGTRFSARVADRLRQKLQGWTVRERVLIIGAGDAGTMIARELRANPQLGIEVAGFVDDDAAKHGNVIHGIPVLGGRRAIEELAQDFAVSKVIIAMPRVEGAEIREIRDICDEARLQAKIVPGMFDIISGRVSVTQLRDVQIEDLLRRPPVETDQAAVADLVNGMTVMVTGAGGSIGREICRQVAQLGAAELILLGHGENSIFEVHHELVSQHPNVKIVPLIADIRNARRIDRIFDTYRPQAVFHAAAHKHVPLMELNPEEAVTNNVKGTANLVNAAERAGVSHFVLISTDKAVNPANVMGATKLLAETLVHDAAARTGRPFVSVRFGNVLASRGSVIPLFQGQIKAGGPITVTHPDMTRYFMTIPEAVQLVLQAAAMGSVGETFVLDMGEPVKIVDLAKDLVQLSGLEVDRDIGITFTGLRPGEKIYEELFTPGEDVDRTRHEKIFRVRNGRAAFVQHARVEELIAAAEGCDGLRLRHLLAELVPGYRDGPKSAERGAASGSGAERSTSPSNSSRPAAAGNTG